MAAEGNIARGIFPGEEEPEDTVDGIWPIILLN